MAYNYSNEKKYYLSRNIAVANSQCVDLSGYFSAWLNNPKQYFENRVVLDIGAGECLYTRYIAEEFKPKYICAVDYFPHRLVGGAAFARSSTSMSVISGDCHCLPFADSSFDVVFGSLVLTQIDLERTAREIFRVLKPGGVYVGIEPNFHNPLIFARFLISRSPNQYILRSKHFDILSGAGFDVGHKLFYAKSPSLRSFLFTSCIGLLLIKKTIAKYADPYVLPINVIVPPLTRVNFIFRYDLSSNTPPKMPAISNAEKLVAVEGAIGLLATACFSCFYNCLPDYIRIALLRRIRYICIVDNEIVGYVYVRFDKSLAFPIARSSAVISVVSTSNFYRNTGIAEKLIRFCLRHLHSKGIKSVFIEAASDNIQMNRVISKIDGWELCGSYLRLGHRMSV